jgi:hypothetical protein
MCSIHTTGQQVLAIFQLQRYFTPLVLSSTTLVRFEEIPGMDRMGISRVKDSSVEVRQISVPSANLDVGLRQT